MDTRLPEQLAEAIRQKMHTEIPIPREGLFALPHRWDTCRFHTHPLHARERAFILADLAMHARVRR